MGTAAQSLLEHALGPDARFRDGQAEAIDALMEPGARLMLVQRTGWGKSLVYFIACKLLRDAGAGPTLLVSPLLALMRNQQGLAAHCGLTVSTINSTNRDDWDRQAEIIEADQADLVLVSPERLGAGGFADGLLPRLEQRCGLLVIDEAHCISDWGHDFRPDYRRILRTVARLRPDTRVLATTATANNRVIEDVCGQLGDSLRVSRGALRRESLALRVIPLQDQCLRLAWLAQEMPKIAGSGIIYCLTVNDTERVAAWLQLHGVDAQPYHADLTHDRRLELEARFSKNQVKALVATTALGMGYDKPDVAFVVHYQMPGSVVAYYQQVGRAGRSLERAEAVLLVGREDLEILEYFIEAAFAREDDYVRVLSALQLAEDGMTKPGIMRAANQPNGRLERIMKLLEVEEVVAKEGRKYTLRKRDWSYASLRADRITAQRCAELEEMKNYVRCRSCRMRYLSQALDDPDERDCGRCDRCAPVPPFVPDQALVQEALGFLKRDRQPIEPRRMIPATASSDRGHKIADEHLLRPGVALCVYNDAGWGKLVAAGKYDTGRFSDDLVAPSVEAVRELEHTPEWVTWVPSGKRPTLVADFARRLAAALGLELVEAVKPNDHAPQKEMMNSSTQYENARGAFVVGTVRPGVCLLVDDVVDSGWTLTAIGIMLRQAGSGPVVPFALASAANRKTL